MSNVNRTSTVLSVTYRELPLASIKATRYTAESHFCPGCSDQVQK